MKNLIYKKNAVGIKTNRVFYFARLYILLNLFTYLIFFLKHHFFICYKIVKKSGGLISLIKSETKKIIILSLFVVSLIMFSIFDYVTDLDKKLIQSAQVFLNQNANQTINDFKKEIEVRKKILKRKLENENIKSLNIVANERFSKIEIKNINQIKNEEYYQKLVENKFFISEIKDKIVIMVLKDNLVLFGECDLKSFDGFFDQELNGGIAKYFLDDTGEIILKNTNQIKFDSEQNNFLAKIFDLEFKNKDDQKKMIDDLKNKSDGFLEFKMGNENYFLNYKSVGVNEINNWYLISIMEKDILEAQAKNILRDTKKLLFIDLSAIIFLMGYIIFVNKKYLFEIKKTGEKLNLLIENIPGGVLRRINNKDFDLVYISDGFLNLLNYSRDEIKNFFDDKYVNIIFLDDINLLKKNIDGQTKEKNNFDVTYRLKKKNGQIIWIAERGKIIDKYIYSVVIDISERKNILDKLKISNEKYKLIAEESDSLIFEVDLKTGLAISNDNFNRMLGFDLPVNNFPENAINKKLIHEDDIKILYDLVKNLSAEKDFYEIEFRIKNKSHEFIWISLFIKLIFDDRADNKKLIKAVRKIKNINDLKREQEKLKVNAEKDLLTGLYNKITSQKLIDEYLSGDGKNKESVLFAIDIDNFKGVNDNLGHLKGDKVLIDVANKLKKIFRKTDIIARFGGDEFMIFVKNIEDDNFIKDRAQEIIKNIKCEVENNKKCVISASVGVAIYPEAGIDFKNLYKNADDALYQAKKSGKDIWRLFKNKKK